MLKYREVQKQLKSTALCGSFFYSFEDLNSSYQQITIKLFSNHPSQEFIDLIKNLFLTTNKNSCDVSKLVSKDYQLFYLKIVRNTIHSFEENIARVESNKLVIKYEYQISQLNDQFLVSTLAKLEECISDLSESKKKKPKIL
jgi:hypothetical protein